jgi:hypothetical protein
VERVVVDLDGSFPACLREDEPPDVAGLREALNDEVGVLGPACSAEG